MAYRDITDADLEPEAAPAEPAKPRFREVSDADLEPERTNVQALEQFGREQRRAMAGMAPDPRDIEDTGDGPVEVGVNPLSPRAPRELPETAKLKADRDQKEFFQAIDDYKNGKGPKPHIATELESDPLAQMVIAGTLTGPLANAVRPLLAARLPLGGAAPVAARVATNAGEAGLQSKLMGGDPVAGAVLGGVAGALPVAPEAAAAVRGSAPVQAVAEGAAKRAETREAAAEAAAGTSTKQGESNAFKFSKADQEATKAAEKAKHENPFHRALKTAGKIAAVAGAVGLHGLLPEELKLALEAGGGLYGAYRGIKAAPRIVDYHLSKLAIKAGKSGTSAPITDAFEAIHNGVPAHLALRFAGVPTGQETQP
jgi:hypothetical protein